MRPVLVGELTSTGHSCEQYWYDRVSSTGSLADQYWLISPFIRSLPTSFTYRNIEGYPSECSLMSKHLIMWAEEE